MSNISGAESEIMRALWVRHPLSAEDILGRLSQEGDWQLGTVKTLLNRLLNKGALQAHRDGRRYLYAPLVARDEWEQREFLSLLDRVFDSRLSRFVKHFSAQRQLSHEDAEILRRFLQEHDDAA